MAAYVGTKIVTAEPCTEHDWIVGRGGTWPANGDNRGGFKVFYPGGYISWTPADTFEANYREITNAERELVTPGFAGRKAPPQGKAKKKRAKQPTTA